MEEKSLEPDLQTGLLCLGKPGGVNDQTGLASRLDPAGEQWMVPGLRKYACEFCLDPNTVHRQVNLSEDGQTVRLDQKEQQYPDHIDRFMDQRQVLSSTGLKGRRYWEVNWEENVVIAVSYRGIRRSGDESGFGNNDQSWSVRINEGRASVHHNRETRGLSVCMDGLTQRRYFLKLKSMIKRLVGAKFSDEVGVSSGRVGVFLDFEAGALSFYKISDNTPTHLHTFITSFTEPLFPGFGLGRGSSVSLVKQRPLMERSDMFFPQPPHLFVEDQCKVNYL